MLRIPVVALMLAFIASCAEVRADGPMADRDLSLPINSEAKPGAGLRVPVTPNEYAGTDVHHMLYLPGDWSQEKSSKEKYPVIVEYTGNKFPQAGSTGRVEDAGLGFGISGGKFIWVTLPMVGLDKQSNAVTWWGDLSETIQYAKINVPRICEQYGGDPNKVFLCGFSRGAIATGFLGLHDDEIAKLWCGFISHDHFDGQREWRGTDWGSPLDTYQRQASGRLMRLNGRPFLVCQSPNTKSVREYLQRSVSLDSFSFVDVDQKKILGSFPNALAVHPHNDRWLLRPSEEREQVSKWVFDVLHAEDR